MGYGLPLAGGAIPATDAFTGTNGTTLPAHDSRWVDTGGGTWDINSNQAEVPDVSEETGCAFNDPATIANHIGIVDIVVSGNYVGGAGARHATGANQYYTFYGEIGGSLYLYDINGTSGTELFSGSSCATNDELGCSAVGSTIKGWKNGLEIVSSTDSTWTTGFTGIAGWANISPRLDNFEAYNIPITVLATTTGTASGQTHNPGTGVTPKAVVAFMFGSTDATDRVSSISYGGVAMTRVPTNGFAQDTAGEPCAIVCYTLLSGIPTGSVSVTYSATGTQRLTVVSFDSVWSALEIKASGKQEGDAANPSITLDSSTAPATRILGVMSGGASLTPNGYAIELSDQALSGAFACWVGHHIMAKTGSAAISATAASDDVAAIAIALGEAAAGGPTTLTPDPVAVPVVAPAVTVSRTLTLTPSPVTVPVAMPAPTLQLTTTLTPSPVAVPVAEPAPTLAMGTKTLAPDAVAVSVVAPAPTLARVYSLAPDPVAVPVVEPAPTLVHALTLTPGAVAVPVVAPDPSVASGTTLAPDPVQVPVVEPAPTLVHALTVTPSPATVPIAVPAPALVGAGSIAPSPVAIAVSTPAPTVVPGTKTLSPDPTQIQVSVPAPQLAGSLALSPSPVAVAVAPVAPSLQRALQLAPDAVAVLVATPAPVVVVDRVLAPTPVAVLIVIPLVGISGDLVVVYVIGAARHAPVATGSARHAARAEGQARHG